jgi:class 3 adenylate cyclase/tetratricopeptide (TPR) repeat protein
MPCTSCGSENEPGRKFCGECGAALVLACRACGSANAPGTKFCGECGAQLVITGAGPGDRRMDQPAHERRVVSVLFADLVGFTTLSESLDAEEVRDLLTRYFDVCRTLIARYGGVVEKFIGDAVMAVWGTPVATEHDSERAVRAAMELTAAVATLGQEIGAPALRARAGVLTGEAAVDLDARGESMVAGDLVNTASRVQSVAPPGAVLVGDATRRATEAAIVYEDAGAHELKGKSEPVQLWRAIRVIGGTQGSLRSEGLEAPFVGRDRELRLVKDMFHAAAEDGRAHLVSVIGAAGTGKSRLMWEFFKYIDGVAFDVRWHRGRCLPYGEGVSFWALAEMVRTNASILEGEDAATALPKLRAAVADAIPDVEERRWVEPRLAHLLGLDERGGKDQEGLFAAWRLFYERLAEQMPTVMVFEDIHWADSALLDFVEHLLEWSRTHPIFVLTLARPDLLDRRPTWGAGSRGVTSIHLEPLPESAMEDLLRGLVPGLGDDLRAQILDRAEGVPLYAVETVRMLLDRGLLAEEGNVYRPTGPITTLEVPETLHAVIAARLDGLEQDERRLVLDASVLGKTFSRESIGSFTGEAAESLDHMLASLVRKQVFSVQSDPLSPERGQYGFLQDLVKQVAYETLSKRERKARHLAAAQVIASGRGPDDDEFVEVVASHLLEAYRLAPDAEDGDAIRGRAAEMLTRAGERAASLAATDEAVRYFEDAAGLAGDAGERARLLERAGMAALAGGGGVEAARFFEQAVEVFESQGLTHPAARVSARIAEVWWSSGRVVEAVERMDRSFQVLVDEEPDEDLATLAAQLGRILFFSGHPDQALERIEWALDVAEGLGLPELLSQALNTKGVIYYTAMGRPKEGFALLRQALDMALEEDAPAAALRAYFNLADTAAGIDRYGDAVDFVDRGLALARRVGDRFWEWQFLGQTYAYFLLGRWDEVIAMGDRLPSEAPAIARVAAGTLLLQGPLIRIARGDLSAARADRDRFPDVESSADTQERVQWSAGLAVLEQAEGNQREALRAAHDVLALRDQVGLQSEGVKEAIVVGIEAAFALGDLDEVGRLLAVVEEERPGRVPQYLAAHASRFRARLDERAGDLEVAEGRLRGVAGLFLELEVPFWTAVTRLELAERLSAWGRSDEATGLAAEAGEIFGFLNATPWIERAAKVAGDRVTAPS